MDIHGPASSVTSWYGRQTSIAIVRDLLGVIAPRSGESLELGSGCNPVLVDELSSHFVEKAWDTESLKLHPHSQIYKTEYESLPFASASMCWVLILRLSLSEESKCRLLLKELARVVNDCGGIFLLKSFPPNSALSTPGCFQTAIQVAKTLGFNIFATRQVADVTSTSGFAVPNLISGVFLGKSIMTDLIRQTTKACRQL